MTNLSIPRSVFLTLALMMAGCASSPTSESTGQYLDSSIITAKVKSELALAEETSALQIEVETYKGTVLLSGFVDSAEESLTAENIASGVDGVVTVENSLVVKK